MNRIFDSILKDRAFSIVTPEGVPLTIQLADPLERLMALVLDMFILLCAVLLLWLLFMFVAGIGFQELVALIIIAVFLIRHGYFIYFEINWNGRTPGKKLLGMRVVSKDGTGLMPTRIVARNLTRDLELFLPLAALLGPSEIVGETAWWLWLPASGWIAVFALLPVITNERTRAGDLIAGTVVVRIPKAVLLDDAGAISAKNEILFTKEQLSFYGERELETLADILKHSRSGKASRSDMQLIARTISKKIGYRGAEPSETPGDFLKAFYRQQRAELERRLLYGQRIESKHDRRRGKGSSSFTGGKDL